MKIEAVSLRKRFGLQWIVHDFTHTFESGSRTAIAGPNGSGKSTLLRLLSAQLLPTEGAVTHSNDGRSIKHDQLYQHISLTGPYLELIEELTGEEMLALHGRLRGFRQNPTTGANGNPLTVPDLWHRVAWSKAIRNQPISSYSSGMMQRLRLLITLASRADVLMLDEPTSNLDAEGVAWYQQLLTDWVDERTLIIASNEPRDFVDCRQEISADAWRPIRRAGRQ